MKSWDNNGRMVLANRAYVKTEKKMILVANSISNTEV